jgi:uncharacterized protein involved in exopolysaccharide biosynthesis
VAHLLRGDGGMESDQYSDSRSMERSGADQSAPELGWGDLLRLLAGYRWLFLLIPVSIGSLMVAYSLSQDRTYTSSAVFHPHGASAGGGLAGVAAQLGMDVPTGGRGDSPAFYARILHSRALLGEVIGEPFAVGGGAERSFADVVEIDEREPRRRRALAIERLQGMTSVQHHRETGTIEISVTSADPQVSVELARRLLAELNQFNLRQRQAQASAERAFVHGRLEEVREDMRLTEERLQNFLRQNRQYDNSPELRFEYERLQRELMNRHQLLMSLTQSYEQARIEEVRDLPVISVVDPPVEPLRPDGRGTIRRGILGGLVGFVLAIGVVLVLEYRRAERTSEPPASDLP